MCLGAQRVDAPPCVLYPDDGRIGGLALRRVFAGAFAKACHATLDIEHIIDNLEREPNRSGVAVQRSGVGGGEGGTARRAQSHCRANERTRFESVHALQFSQRKCLAHALQIDRLSPGHPTRTRCNGKKRDLCR